MGKGKLYVVRTGKFSSFKPMSKLVIFDGEKSNPRKNASTKRNLITRISTFYPSVLPCYICNERSNLSSCFSVLSPVEMVSDAGPCCAAEEQIDVILNPNRKLLSDATLVSALHGLQENGVR